MTTTAPSFTKTTTTVERYTFADQSTYERTIREYVADYPDVLGKDAEGRVIVDMYGYHTFGLTLCCNASDTGDEFGVVCRACRGSWDVGVYNPDVALRVVQRENIVTTTIDYEWTTP